MFEKTQIIGALLRLMPQRIGKGLNGSNNAKAWVKWKNNGPEPIIETVLGKGINPKN